MSKLRQSARGQECTLRIPHCCNGNPETTVLAHIDCRDKGIGFKSPDFFGVFACSSCHEALDRHQIPKEQRAEYTLSALYETWKTWIKTGLVRV